MTPISAKKLNDSLVSLDWPYFDDISDVIENNGIHGKQTIHFHITINPDLSYLAGHFPQQPIVPGVVQVHWAGELSKQFFDCDGFSSLKKVKFSNPILPKTSLLLSVSFKEGSQQVNFTYSDEKQTYSSGVILFI